MPAARGLFKRAIGGRWPLSHLVGLALFGVDKAPASAYSWFYFLSQWLPITAVGLYYLHREGLSLRSLGQVQDPHA